MQQGHISSALRAIDAAIAAGNVPTSSSSSASFDPVPVERAAQPAAAAAVRIVEDYVSNNMYFS